MTRILLVEDDPDVAPALEIVLASSGYTVETARTFADAMALLDHHTYDLVLTDGRLPDGSGLDVVDKAASLGMRAMVVTGYATQFAPERLNRHPWLLKPVRAAELLDAVGDCLAAGV